jgi:hypothetical protein
VPKDSFIRIKFWSVKVSFSAQARAMLFPPNQMHMVLENLGASQ